MWILLGAALAAPLDEARALLEEGRVTEAVAALEKLTVAEPGDGSAWFNFGLALLREGRFQEGLRAFQRAEELGVMPALSRYNAACALARAGRPNQALDALRSALELGFSGLQPLRDDPDLASLRALPAFKALVAELETVDVLRIATGRDGLWASASTLRARLGAACSAGQPLACALREAPLGDRQALKATLQPACDEGSAAACLGVAWTLLAPSATGEFPGAPAERSAFVASIQKACDGGLARGCTELGYAHDLGLVAYPNRRRGKELWRQACQRVEPRACTALALANEAAPALDDDPMAMLLYEPEDPAQALPVLERACLAGASLGCARLAARAGALPQRALAQVSSACAEREPAACALTAQLALVGGTTTLEAALPQLDAACPILPEACEEADFLRQGAVPVAGYPDPAPHPKEVQRGLFDRKQALHACLLGAVRRDPDAAGWVDLALRLDAQGHIAGVHVREPFDEEYQRCLIEALKPARIRPAGPHPARVEVSLPAFHGAGVKLASLVPGGEGGAEVAQLARDTDRWREPLDACAARQGLVADDLSLELTLFADRSGRLRDVRITEALDEPELERCVVDWLSAHEVSEPPRIGTPMRAEIRLFQPREEEKTGEEATVAFEAAGEAPGEPVVVNMLVLSVTRARVERARGRLSPASLRSIEQSHREMADAVERMTQGRVRIEPTFRTIDTTLRIESDGETDGIRRFQLPLDDPSFLERAAIEPGAYDSLMVWGPIPLGFPQPALGVTYQGVTLAGATVSSGVIPSRRALRANPGVPAYELPLHEWWHQVEGRARDWLRLETAWPPLNHTPLEVAGKRLDPRTWLGNPNDTTMGWYEHVLGSMPRAFWADVWARGEQISMDEANLARRALPIGEGVTLLAGLTDSVLSFGRYALPASTDEAEAPWFGLWWPTEQRVGRVVVHTGSRGDPGAASWSGAILELAEGDDSWLPIEAEPTRDGPVWTWVFPAREISGLRLRPAPAGDPRSEVICREIEAWPQ